MISTPNRCRAVELIDEAMAQGARQEKACALLGISVRTYQRWTREGGVEPDRRPEALRPAPANRLSEAERERILEVCNQPEYASLPPSQIVPMLVDQGEYIASESTFYRVLREAGPRPRSGRRNRIATVPRGRTRYGAGTSPTWPAPSGAPSTGFTW